MMPTDEHLVTFGLERHRDQRAQSPIAKHEHALISGDADLREDFVRGRERLNENRALIGYRVGQGNKVALGKTEMIGKRTVTAENPKDRAIRTMTSEAVDASATCSACRIYLAG